MIVVAAACLSVCIGVFAGEAAGPPTPVPYKRIADPADDAERHVVVTAEDRGPVWLYTGILNHMVPSMIDRIKPNHFRGGFWPYWYPASVAGMPKSGQRTSSRHR